MSSRNFGLWSFVFLVFAVFSSSVTAGDTTINDAVNGHSPAASSPEGSIWKVSEETGVVTGTLPNGLKVVLIPLEGAKSFAKVLRVNVGFLDEVPSTNPNLDETGEAHRLEHLVFRGTKKLPSKAEFENELERLGLQNNASTTFERTNYFFIGETKNFGKASELMADMMAEPLLTAKDAKSEDHPIEEEARRNLENNPVFALYEIGTVLQASKTEGARLGHLMTGDPIQIREKPAEVVRNFYEKHYSADKMTLVVTGGLGDLNEAMATIEKEYSRIPNRKTPAPVTAQWDVMPKVDPSFPLYRVKTPAKSTRMLDVRFPMVRDVKTEAAARLLELYLNRPGKGGMLQPLMEDGLVFDGGFTVDTMRNVMSIRAVLDLSADGEKRVDEVLRRINAALGAVAAKELPKKILEELKRTYLATRIQSLGLLETAEQISDAVEDYSLDKVDALSEALTKVEVKDIQSLAARLIPEAANLTLLSPDVKGELHPTLKLNVEKQELADRLPELQKIFRESTAVLDTKQNPYFYENQPSRMKRKGIDVVTIPPSEYAPAQALIELGFSRLPSSAEESIASMLLFQAFELEPENVRFFYELGVAGINVDFAYDPGKRSLVIRADGGSNAATNALAYLLTNLKKYTPTERALEQAKERLIERIRDLPASSVGIQALSQGLHFLEGGASRDIQKEIELVKKVDLTILKRVQEIGKKRWSVKMITAGHWGDAALQKIFSLVVPSIRKPNLIERHSEKLKVNPTEDVLLVRPVEVARQGVARVFPLNVQKYGAERWVFEIFSRILSKRLMEVVRTEIGLVYDVRAGFEVLDTGGAALYIYGDTSKKSVRMAMAYTVTLATLLEGDFTKDEFNAAKKEVLDLARSEGQGLDGIYRRQNEGYDPKLSISQIVGLKKGRLLEVARKHLLEGRKIDSVAAGAKDPVCQKLLTTP